MKLELRTWHTWYIYNIHFFFNLQSNLLGLKFMYITQNTSFLIDWWFYSWKNSLYHCKCKTNKLLLRLLKSLVKYFYTYIHIIFIDYLQVSTQFHFILYLFLYVNKYHNVNTKYIHWPFKIFTEHIIISNKCTNFGFGFNIRMFFDQIRVSIVYILCNIMHCWVQCTQIIIPHRFNDCSGFSIIQWFTCVQTKPSYYWRVLVVRKITCNV